MLLLMQGDYDSALFHFQQLLQRNPRHYPALAQLVQLLRWAGRPQDAKQYLEAALANKTAAHGNSSTGVSSSTGATSSSSSASTGAASSPAAGSAASGNGEPGYHYCMGLWCK
jgi:tetratricopeptide (TPR) repeat protein